MCVKIIISSLSELLIGTILRIVSQVGRILVAFSPKVSKVIPGYNMGISSSKT
jgi:hypothetical protein